MSDEIRVVTEPPRHPEAAAGDAPIGELFKQLAQDSSLLVKQEMALAKSEITASMRGVAKDFAYLAAGGAVLLMGLLVLTAFLVVLTGDIFDNYWLGALIIGLLYAVIGAVLVARGKAKLQQESLKPEQTIATLKQDKRWASAGIEQVKRGLSS